MCLDIHPCKSDKWSKETRVTDVEFAPLIRTCGDVRQYLDLWDNFPNKYNEPVKMRNPEWWWQLSQHGRLSDGTKWKSAFTLRYSSLRHAIFSTEAPSPRYERKLKLVMVIEKNLSYLSVIFSLQRRMVFANLCF
jgi:hypothetical protein